jgi:hypothetical protein
MMLNFPNQSRSFDERRHRVCFWGYDGPIEISFYAEADALQTLTADVGGTEAWCLKTFDAGVERIHAAASRVYKRGKGAYAFTLGVEDF